MYTKEQIIIERKNNEENTRPKRQLISRLNTFYRGPEKELEDALELQQAINEAKKERLSHAS